MELKDSLWLEIGIGLLLLAGMVVRADDSSAGKTIYSAKCASCHGKDAKGNAGMAKVFKINQSALDLTDKETLGKSEKELINTTTNGMNKMPAFKGKLAEAEIAGVVAYVKNTGGSSNAESKDAQSASGGQKKKLSAQDGSSSAGAGLFSAKCASCHGKDAKGNAGMAKMFKVDVAALDLLDKTTSDKTNEELTAIITNGGGKMPAYKGKLKDLEIAEVLAYVRSLAEKQGGRPALNGDAKNDKNNNGQDGK
ncbi:MAG: c-type cytochrome [Elusimicrobia bacterium]|nr:c-type cytochrome [Elusimicrobiota bacterium]